VGRSALKLCLIFTAAPILAWTQAAAPHTPSARQSDDCKIYQVTSLPGSHQFGSDFIEALVSDPAASDLSPAPAASNLVWALTADLSTDIPLYNRALYISKSTNRGESWTPVVRLDSKYLDADIGEGLRNGLGISSHGSEFIVTSQRGAFQVIPRPHTLVPLVNQIDGPLITQQDARVAAQKREGDPIRASVVEMTADESRLFIAYGYFDRDPQIFSYHKAGGAWIADGALPHLPSSMDIFSMQFDDPKKLNPHSLYVGTGDQAYRLDLNTKEWTRISGVGPDSAIHGITTIGGLHLAACWSVYNPVGEDVVKRAIGKFFYHRAEDEISPDVRAYSVDVDPVRTNRLVVTSLTGVYVSKDSGQTWLRFNDLPDGEFHSAHFNPDGTVIVSGFVGTFLTNPFSEACSPHLRTRVAH
jgi:hypothetical protein